jgi:4-hydroxy-tetrahydrodipicolinate synthase
MKYRRSEAKEFARAHMKGIWAAALMPFHEDLSIDEKGFRRNLRHWVDDLGIDGVFIAGKQSEFF